METQTQMHHIFLVVSSTGTFVGKAIRIATRVPYSHASLSPDASLKQMYSFCRNYIPFPFPATFNEELIGQGVFGRYPSIPCEIYRIPVTQQQHEQFLEIIGHFQDFRKYYSYSVMGLLRVKLQIEKQLSNKFVCSQFVAYMLKRCGVKLSKSPSLYAPDDLRFLPQAELIYRGELNRYYEEQRELSEIQTYSRIVV